MLSPASGATKPVLVMSVLKAISGCVRARNRSRSHKHRANVVVTCILSNLHLDNSQHPPPIACSKDALAFKTLIKMDDDLFFYCCCFFFFFFFSLSLRTNGYIKNYSGIACVRQVIARAHTYTYEYLLTNLLLSQEQKNNKKKKLKKSNSW